MKDRRVEIRGDLKEAEVEGLVHEEPRQAHGQGPPIEVLGQNRSILGLVAMFAGADYTIKDALYRVRMLLRTLGPTEYAARTLRRAA